jgi:tRNA pseudouridine55 synthase
VYDATIGFGTETDTDDATGSPVRSAPPPTLAAVEGAVAELTGTIEQTPPAFSAKQVGGTRAHTAARAGVPLALAPSMVTVHAWELTGYDDGLLRATVTCSGGTYVRALARDLGRRSGSAAHLATLRRRRSGPFSVDDAVPLDRVRDGAFELQPPVAVLPGLQRVRADDAGIAALRQGRAIAALGTGERAAVLDARGDFVALAERDGNSWRPRVVFPT